MTVIRKILLLSIAIIFSVVSSQALAISPQDLQSLYGDSEYYWPGQCGSSSSSSTSTPTGSLGGGYDTILQAIAVHESGGSYTSGSPGGASGRFAFEPATWQSAAQTYPPAGSYSYASAAPGPVQDAAAYLWALNAYKKYNGDPFWMAIYWYESGIAQEDYPNKSAANLQVAPPGNNGLTLADFGNTITQEVQSGQYNGTPISSVALAYNSAPDFQTYLTQAGGAPAGTSSPTDITSSNSDSSASSASCCGGSSISIGSSTQGAGTWQSDTQPPYYLEDFVINVLEDIASVANVPQSDTVTQEHVVALVAWAYAEGGNIANTDIFNPWNTGLNDPSLIAGTAAGNGVQSFKSFDAGVTAATRTMTGSNQNRLEQTLIDPNSTAEQFMQALTYYQNYPGNQAWAGADEADQQSYLNTLMNVLQQTRSNYAQEASIEIGPGQEGTNHVPTSQLKFSGGSGNPSGGGVNSASCQGNTGSVNCNGQTATGDAAIACDVLQYDTLSYSQAWHSSGSVFHSKCPSIGPQCATDCSGLVNIAIYDVFHNDIDENTYGEVADTTNFKEIPFSQVQPGDLIQPKPDHVEIIESIQGNTINTFAAHTDQLPQPQQVGPAQYTNSPGYVYLQYIGQGATSQ